jgi:hypothetical protein
VDKDETDEEDKNNDVKNQMYEKPGMRAVIADIRMLKTILKGTDDKNVNMDHIMDKKPEMDVNMEYEADIQVHHAGETDMFEEKTVVKYRYEKPGGRDGMTYINSKRKYNEAIVVGRRVT